MTSDRRWRAPYPGLRSFRRDETDLFFGREDCISAMVDRLAAGRFLAVLGSSGTGKSSLVKTGLLDALELGLMDEAGSNWHVVDFQPGGASIKNLARRLIEKEQPDASNEHAAGDVELLRAFLERGPRSIIEWCRAGHLPKGANLLLLVDQFEELFLYQGYAGREQAEAFVALLTESARTKEFPIYVVLTMRSEYLGACALIEDLAEVINRSIYLTPRMTREQCREAIVGPAAVCDVEIEPALVNRLLNDLANFAPWDDDDRVDQLDRLVRRADQLPLLQYTLNRTWMVARAASEAEHVTLTLAAYESVGGLRGALNAHADQIYEDLNRHAAPVETIFRALTAGSTVAEAVRRPTRMGDLVALCGGDEAGVRAVVDAFRVTGCNFLTPELDPENPKPVTDDTYIDISHESLIRQWKRLSEWLEKEARSAQEWRRLLDRYATAEPLRGRELVHFATWRDDTKPNAVWARRYGGDYPAVIGFLERSYWAERRKRRLSRIAAAAVFVLLAGAAGVSSYAFYRSQQNYYRAENERQRAEVERQRAESSYAAAKKALNNMVFDVAEALASVSGMHVQTITNVLKSVREVADNLATSNPNDTDLDRYRAALLGNFAEVYAAAGATDLARKTHEEALSIYETLASRTGADTRTIFEFATALWRLGSMLEDKDGVHALELFKRELVVDRQLVEREPKEVRWLERVADALGAIGNLQLKAGNTKEATQAYEDLLIVNRKLAEREPNGTQQQREILLALDKLIEVRIQTKDTAGVDKAYEERLGILRILADREPARTSLRSDLIADLQRVADRRLQNGDAPGALKALEEALEGSRKLAGLNPDVIARQSDVAFALEKIGNLRLQTDDTTGAAKAYDEMLGIFRALALRQPAELAWPRDIAISLGKIGDLREQTRDLDGALKAFEEMLVAYRNLPNPTSVEWENSTSAALEKVAAVRSKLGDVEGMRAAYEEALGLYRDLAARDASPVRTAAIAFMLGKVADARQRGTDPDSARPFYEEAIAVQRTLVAAEPQNPQRLRNLANALEQLALFDLRKPDVDAARKLYQEYYVALDGIVPLARGAAAKAKSTSELVSALGNASFSAILAEKPVEAAQLADEALKLDDKQPWIKVNRAHAYLLSGKFADAKDLYVAVKDVHRKDSQDTYLSDITNDFALMRQLGIASADIDRMKTELGI